MIVFNEEYEMDTIVKVLLASMPRKVSFAAVLFTDLFIIITHKYWREAYANHHVILGVAYIIFFIGLFGILFSLIFEIIEDWGSGLLKKQRYKSLSKNEYVTMKRFIDEKTRVLFLNISDPDVALLMWDKVFEKVSEYPKDKSNPTTFAVAIPKREWIRLQKAPRLLNSSDN